MSVRRIETVIEIDAPAARVWSILTDFQRMPSWNPFMTAISGQIAEGSRLSVRIVPPGKSGMHFKPVLLAVRPERQLRWLGHVLFPGLFDGEHYFLLEPLAVDRTRFTQGERFSGPLVAVFSAMLPATEAGFKAMNAALKREAESGR